MENWAAIASEVAGAIASVGFAVTLEKPGVPTGPEWAPTPGTPATFVLTALDETIDIKDGAGTLTGKTMRQLTVGATVAVPNKGDRIQVRGVWHEIMDVKPLAPGGGDLMFELRLAS